MSHYLRLSFRLFDAVFHARGDGGGLEWPPSPLRAFQALVAAAGQRWRKDLFDAYARDPLTWLEGLGSPELIVPTGVPSSTTYRLYVPNNHTDIVAAAWSGGDPLASIAEHRVEKDVRSTRLIGGETVHYLWPVTPDRAEYVRVLNEIAREVSHLGWGTDQAAASLSIVTTADVGRFVGERWMPAEQGGTLLRVPQPAGPATVGTLADLRRKHADFVGRLGPNGFKPVPPLRAFRVVGYCRATDTVSRPFVAFELRTPDFERSQPFNPTRHACAVAGMVRNALADLARQMRPFGWTGADINTFVHGHTPDGERPARGPDADLRFAYLPLPSLEHRGGAGVVVTGIRRVLVVGPPGGDREVAWARVLSGQELTPLNDRTPPAALRLIDKPAAALRTDPNLGPYVGNGAVWSTVTPVVLPGFDDGSAEKAEGLLRKAFKQAGMPPELVQAASLEWRQVGFRAGVDLATRYQRPEPCRLSRYHVRVRWPVPIRGPLVVGAVRYRGLGIFAAE